MPSAFSVDGRGHVAFVHPIRAAAPALTGRPACPRAAAHATTLIRPRPADARRPGTTPSGAGRGWSNRAGGPGTRHGRGSPPRPPRLRGRPRPARRRPVPRGRSCRSSAGGARCGAARPGHGPRPRWPSAGPPRVCRQRPPRLPQGGFPGARQMDRTTSGASYSPARSAANRRAAAAASESSTPATTGSSGPGRTTFPSRTTTTGQCAWVHTVRATDPRRNPRSAPSPRSPRTSSCAPAEASTSAEDGPSKTGSALTSSPGARARARSAPSSAVLAASDTRAAAGGAGALPTASAG